MADRGHARPGRISATRAAKNFGRLVDRVREERATYIVDRGGIPVARISPAEGPAFTMRDLKALLGDRRRVDDEYLRAVEEVVDRHSRPRVRRNPWAR
jgi:antitoxin (DNA-binding transcriptional repressor) of toxin-antitoxin stability system